MLDGPLHVARACEKSDPSGKTVVMVISTDTLFEVVLIGRSTTWKLE
jgi:hypothetical protein